jgi:peroxiredoxin
MSDFSNRPPVTVSSKLVAAADIKAMPTSFLIDRAGNIRMIHVGFDPDKSPRQYAEEIEELLKEPKP